MKYGYQLPLYRQEQMFAAQGITLDRQTLASWMGRAAWWLKPLYKLLRDTVMSHPRLFADETPLPVLDPGRGRTKVCQFWAIATDDRPWGGPAPPAVVFMRRPSDAAGVLLRACAAEVLGRSRRDQVADCRGSAATDRDVLRHRGSHPRSAGGASGCSAANRHQAVDRGLQTLARGAAAGSLKEVRSGQSHPLHPQPLERPDALHR